MSINLLNSSNARVDFGDIPSLAGLTAYTVAISIKPSTMASALAILGQWGSLSTLRAFLMQTQDTDEIGFVSQKASDGFFGVKTTNLNMTSGTVYRIVVKTNLPTSSCRIFVNNAEKTTTSWFASAISALENSTNAFQVGYQSEPAGACLSGDYAEVAIWSGLLSDADCLALSNTADPGDYPTNGILYSSLYDTSNLNSEWNLITATNSSGTTSAWHPIAFGASGAAARRRIIVI